MAIQSDGSLRFRVIERVRNTLGAGLYTLGDLVGSTRTRLLGLRSAAERALSRGDPDRAEELARELLEAAGDFRDHWYHGNALHHGHQLLGRVHLRRGDPEAAERELLEAGRTPGSPQLVSFGPNMTLARELLLEGRREAVLEYLELCRAFWCPDDAEHPSASQNRDRLDGWVREIRAGRVPDFGPNLIY